MTITIAIAGGPASGKKTVQTALHSHLLKALPDLSIVLAHLSDHKLPGCADPSSPDAYDFPALKSYISSLPASVDVLLLEGAYLFTQPDLLPLLTVKVYVDCDADVRLARRVVAVSEEGLDAVLKRYVEVEKEAYERWCAPTKVLGDIILPGTGVGEEGDKGWMVGVELVAEGVAEDLRAGTGGKVVKEKGEEKRRVLVDRTSSGYYDTV